MTKEEILTEDQEILMQAMAEALKEHLNREVKSRDERLTELQSKLDRQQQQLSANQKHCQALERKIGALSQ